MLANLVSNICIQQPLKVWPIAGHDKMGLAPLTIAAVCMVPGCQPYSIMTSEYQTALFVFAIHIVISIELPI